MNGLCSHERLELALAGSLNADEESTLHLHLEDCELCSAEMERLSGGEQASREIAALLVPDELDDALPLREECSTADFVVEHLEPSDDPAVLGRLGGYDVLDIIGRGGMGVVLKGFDRELKRFVAIKALAPHLAHSPLARKRFAREAQAAAAVVNLHVIAIHQVQPNGQLPFLVMPLLTGESLAQRIKTRGTLELKEILRIGMQAAEGLAAAHGQGLIHRDVKPANILLEKGVERAVLTDFGLARAADDVSMTRQGVVAGTPEYMSPEQARGEALDGRSDLFSLGCVLYEMATGVSPFRTDSTMATLRRIVDEQPAAMASLVPELPPWFCHIVKRLLSKDPAQRFASASEVSQLLEQCLSHIQQPTSVPLPASLVPHTKGRRSIFNVTRKGVLAMLGTIGMTLLGMVLMQATEPPDIAGEWTSEEWGVVEFTEKGTGKYEGTYTNTFQRAPHDHLKPPLQLGATQDCRKCHNGLPLGQIELMWSRVERRFNGTWKAGDDRKGKLSLRLVGDEIRGAWTTSKTSLQPTGTARLSEFIWNRSSDNATTSPPSYIRKLLIGKIQSIDIERRVARIDLGTADSVTVGMRFNVSAKAAEDAKESPFRSKGSIEVIRVLDQHISEARILHEDLEDKLTVNDEAIGVDKSQSLETDQSLAGVWEVVMPSVFATEGPEDQRRRLVIVGTWFATFEGSQRLSASRIKVESQHTPKRISGVDLGLGWTNTHGIYEVDGNILRLSLAPDTEALPTKFGPEHLKRVKGKLAEEQLAALKSYSKKATTTDASSTTPPNDATAALHPPFEFRIAASKADHEADGVAWFPIVEPRIPAPAGKSGANLSIEEKVDEKWRGLLWDKAEHTLFSDGTWRVVKCEVVRSAHSTDLVPSFDIQIKLDAVGGALLRRLTATHLNQTLAIVVEGTIVAGPIIRSEFGEDFVITGNFSKAAAEKLAATIRKPDPRKRARFGLSFADAKSALVALKDEAARRKLRGFEATIDARLNSIAITAADAETLGGLREILGQLDTSAKPHWRKYGVTPAPVSELTAKVLESIGLHLAPITKDRFRAKNVFEKYSGGLDVTFVRSDNGTAGKAGIHEADIVVKLQGRLMLNLADLDAAMQIKRTDADSLQFDVLRSGETVRVNVPFPDRQLDQR